MRKSFLTALAAVIGLIPSLLAVGVGPAAADAPPPAWGTDDRTLTCGTESVTAQWSRGGVLTVLLVQGSTDVIVPKLVQVTPLGATQSQTTLAVPGFDPEDLVACEYTDPAGRFVQVWGLRS